ncbi:hypothetical protein LBMAG27_15150 [Bacteroidota bacterium]|nr:hypothetical protein LBMAG27_15150 [Bacteroidota bacterium]
MKKIFTLNIVVLTTVLFLQSDLFAQQHYMIDRSFGETCGISVIAGIPSSLEQIEIFKLSDGSYIEAGDVFDQGLLAYLILLTKFNNDGTVDSSFGTNGVVQHTFDQRNSVSCAAMVNDKIYVVGGESPSNAGSSVRAYIARFNADGTPDSTFNSIGRVVELISTNPISGSIFSHIAIQPDGKVIAFGSEFGNINGGATIPVARRYNFNGSLDNTFHPAITYPGFNSMVASTGGHSAGVIDANGSIRFLYTINPNLAGQFIEQIVTVKINSMGEPDITYGINGMNGIPVTAYNVNRYFADPQNNIYAQGWVQNGSQSTRVVRIKPNGDADSAFAINGVFDLMEYPGSNSQDYGRILHRDSQGRIWSMGGAGLLPFGDVQGTIYRFDSTATYDLSLDGLGYTTIVTPPSGMSFKNAYFENDNEIVVNSVNGNGGGISLLKLKLSTEVITISNSGSDTICAGEQTSLFVNQVTDCYTYQWKKDGNDFASITDSSITIDSAGSYQVTAIVGNDTFVSQTIIISVQICDGVNDFEEQSIFTVYPNPASDELSIQSGSSNKNYLITDITGRVLLQIENKDLQNLLKVSLHLLNAGTYFIVSEDNLQRKQFAVIK